MKKRSGFTLIELLVSVGIISLISVVIAQVFFTTTRSSVKIEITKDAKQNGNFAISSMERMIRNAHSVASVCSTSGTTTESLSLLDADGNTTTLGCMMENSVTRIASVSASGTYYLTSDNVTLGGVTCSDVDMTLSFTCTSYPAQPSRIGISFTLSQVSGAPDSFEKASSTFQSTVNIRNLHN